MGGSDPVRMIGLNEAVSSYSSDWLTPDHPGQIPALSSGDLHLVALNLADLTEQNLGAILDRRDLDRGLRIRDPDKRRLYLGGRYGLKVLLSAYTNTAISSLEFGYGSRGKPRLCAPKSRAAIEFNYTLSGDRALYGFCLGREIGVDMELLPRNISAARMATSRLTAEEQAAWESLPEVLRNDGMLCCWTRKEAYGKAIGVGIRFRLGTVNLFTNLDRPDWQTPLTGLFNSTDPVDMPRSLWGLQLSMPFNAVAAVMVATDDQNAMMAADSPPPLAVTTFNLNAARLIN